MTHRHFAQICTGPILFEDAHLVNKLAQFNREKVPERVVHARGMTAKGFFEVRYCMRSDAFGEKGTAVQGGVSVIISGHQGKPPLMLAASK